MEIVWSSAPVRAATAKPFSNALCAGSLPSIATRILRKGFCDTLGLLGSRVGDRLLAHFTVGLWGGRGHRGRRQRLGSYDGFNRWSEERLGNHGGDDRAADHHRHQHGILIHVDVTVIQPEERADGAE